MTHLQVFCIHSPYRRTIQTSDKVRKAFRDEEVLGVQEEVQLREQDFGGSFQVPLLSAPHPCIANSQLMQTRELKAVQYQQCNIHSCCRPCLRHGEAQAIIVCSCPSS